MNNRNPLNDDHYDDILDQIKDLKELVNDLAAELAVTTAALENVLLHHPNRMSPQDHAIRSRIVKESQLALVRVYSISLSDFKGWFWETAAGEASEDFNTQEEAETDYRRHIELMNLEAENDDGRCEHGMFFSGAGACPGCGH